MQNAKHDKFPAGHVDREADAPIAHAQTILTEATLQRLDRAAPVLSISDKGCVYADQNGAIQFLGVSFSKS